MVPKTWSQGLATIAVQDEYESTTMKSTSTISESVCMGNLIQLLGTIVFPSKLTRGESQDVRFLGFKFSPLYRLGYIISTALPWSTSTLFTSYPPILRVTTKVSSWGWMVLILSSSEKPRTSWISILALFGSKLESSVGGQVKDITLDGQDSVLPRAVKMTLIDPRGGLEGASLRGSKLVCFARPLEWCNNSFNFPSQTSCSKWSYKFLYSSVVCPWS